VAQREKKSTTTAKQAMENCQKKKPSKPKQLTAHNRDWWTPCKPNQDAGKQRLRRPAGSKKKHQNKHDQKPKEKEETK
jgi:hypothetical protein